MGTAEVLREPIAIIGTGCRFPGQASSPSRLWELLRRPRDLLRRIPEDRFGSDGFYHPDPEYHGNSNTKHSYFLDENVRQFDTQFFGIKPVEANAIDPQQRLLLEVVYEALEAAGKPIESLRGSDTSVYVGCSLTDYDNQLARDVDNQPTYQATGTHRSIVANRISYFFDWTGPSMAIDTACSSSLVALHQAVQTLRHGESKVAVVGGTNLILGPEVYLAESQLRMLSPTGRSRMFDADADGYARGEGVAAVILKTLSAAIEDGDTIECIIRETGVNQDGRTNGITMPSPVSQLKLIRQVYANAGLDPTKAEDRCQFFECHGTGTPAGDPVEAQAISEAFFRQDAHQSIREAIEPTRDPLYVGSIKTIIGHTEATAGLAGLIKALLALKHSVIPPNMLFGSLNPKVAPFYSGLCVPLNPLPWPRVPPGQPRRASVNSFGFGGTNSHVILESYEIPKPYGLLENVVEEPEPEPGPLFAPLVLSANSQISLKLLIKAYATYLRENGDNISSRCLFRTLYSHRSVFGVRKAFSGVHMDSLVAKLEAAASSPETNIGIEAKPLTSEAKILGVFTGQGAQWSAMGRELLLHSDFARTRLQELDARLQRLPDSTSGVRPSWTLSQKLLDGQDIGEACFSQPLCTAVQIILVDLLGAAGVRFHAVVGHSSGEIAAAYAAGHLAAEDAICIAYYRGLYAYQARGPGGQKGKMMAVATSRPDAQELCDLPHFKGRICVAAHNAPDSVTLSGDEDAIAEAQASFEDEDKTAKLLFVDTAYHSHHMSACSESYKDSLSSLKPQLFVDKESPCKWFSSVYNDEAGKLAVQGRLDPVEYWNANMVGQVLFADALEKACAECGPFDAAVEVGPHPALKRPAITTIEESTSGQRALPYTGVLQRGKNDIESMAEALGYLWSVLGYASTIDIQGYQELINGYRAGRFSLPPLRDLPSYSWDKEGREYWHESRLSRVYRTRKDPTHVLLGNQLPDGTHGKEYRWRNYLSPKEVPWLDEHQVQGQPVFPAAGYAVMALEAATKLLASLHDTAIVPRLVEIQDMSIQNALAFPADGAGVETLFTLTNVSETVKDGGDTIQANFCLYAALNNNADTLAPKANGLLKITTGEPSADVLPMRTRTPEPNMVQVDSDRFYDSLSNVGFGYTGHFRGLQQLRRKSGLSSGLIVNHSSLQWDEWEAQGKPLLLHPAFLDVAFQAIMLAYCYPDDGRLWSIHVPRQIRSIRINPELCTEYLSRRQGTLPFEAAETHCGPDGVVGDVDVYTPGDEPGADQQFGMIQVQGLHFVPFTEASAENDTKIFSTTVWGPALPDLAAVCYDGRATAAEYDLAMDLERACLFYMNSWEREIPKNHPARTSGPYKGLFNFISDVRERVAADKHKYVRKKYMDDDENTLRHIQKKHGGCLDMMMVDTVGQNIPAVIRGETTMLEHLFKDDLLSRYYSGSLGMKTYTKYLARGVKQLTHRYPSMKILEVGAGTGHATKQIFAEIGHTLASYHFTDVSSGFFEKAQEVFEDFEDKMVFKVLDMEKDIASQGFEPGSFDLVVASFVLHITKNLQSTLQNIRRLLKPGGYLLLAELTDNEPMRSGFCFGSLPGWWIGEEDGRALSPCVAPVAWDSLLRQTGFSGVDSITNDLDPLPCPASIIVSQAMDEKIGLLREPATTALLGQGPINDSLVIIGGSSLKTARLVQQVRSLVAPLYNRVTLYKGLDEVDLKTVLETCSNDRATILNLSDLDDPLFANFTAGRLQGLKTIFESARTIVWFTAGRRSKNPYMNMSVGFGRSMIWEIPGLHLHYVDLAASEPQTPSPPYKADDVASTLLQFDVLAKWTAEAKTNNMLWSVELEIEYDADGRILIPRLVENEEANRRYNSSRRAIEEKTYPSDASIMAEVDSKSANETGFPPMQLVRGESLEFLRKTISNAESSSVLIHVTYSSTWCAPIGRQSHLHVLFGQIDGTGEQAVAVSENAASSIVLPLQRVVSRPYSLQPSFVELVVDNLIATSLLSDLTTGDTLLILEPNTRLASLLSHRAAALGVHVKFISVSEGRKDSPKTPQDWIRISPRLRQRDLVLGLPPTIERFANMSIGAVDTGTSELAKAIEGLLPRTCDIRRPVSIYTQISCLSRLDKDRILRSSLEDAVDRALAVPGDLARLDVAAVSVTELRRLMPFKARDPRCIPEVVSWRSAEAHDTGLPVTIRPADHSPLFKSDRSYWLVGLTRDLGLSLTEWMIRHGAKHIVLSSRNPMVDPVWMDRVCDLGGVVRLLPCDVTSHSSVQSCYAEITSQCPPLAGIAQAAMVLRDSLVSDMDLDKMSAVLGPKVQGSLNIEAVLPSPDDGLDFFIYFSSMAGLVGNLGQSNYSTANAFMMSQARARRARGLAASVINIGVIVGVGYITREVSQATLEDVREGGYMWLPEQSFHAMFAEAVLAGRRDSVLDPEISTGVAHVGVWEQRKPIWFTNPRFSHHVVHAGPGAADPAGGETAGAAHGESLQALLRGARSVEEVSRIVRDAFLIKLQNLLKFNPAEGRSDAAVLALQTSDLGVDSLIAVEIRKWFLKELAVNIAVLKILGGASIKDIVEDVVSQLSTELTPNLGQGQGEKLKSSDDYSISPGKTVVTVQRKESEDSPPSPAQPRLNGTSLNSGHFTSWPEITTGGGSGEFRPPVNGFHESRQTNGATECNGQRSFGSNPGQPSTQRSGPLSHGQLMFWIVDMLTEDLTTLNHTGLYRIKGRVRTADLQRAVAKVASRHEILRTCFQIDDLGQPSQVVLQQPRVQLEVEFVAETQDVFRALRSLQSHIFKLETGETIRLILVETASADESFLLCGCHHIIVDGASQQVLMRDLERAYKGESLGPPPLQYLDFAARQRDESNKGDDAWAKELAYWKNILSDSTGPLPILPLPDAATNRTRLSTYKLHRVSISLSPALTQDIDKQSRKLQATPFHFYLSAFRTLLARLIDLRRYVENDATDSEPFSIGIASNNRTDESSDSIGPYVNLLPLCFPAHREGTTFEDILRDTRSRTLEAMEHSAVPFGALLNELHVARSDEHSPVFQTFVDYREGAARTVPFADLQLELVDFQTGRTPYDVNLDIIKTAEGCRVEMMVQSSLYSESDAQALLDCYQSVLDEFSRNPQRDIYEPRIFSPHRIAAAVELGKGPVLASKWEAETLAHRVRDIAREFGADEAIRDGHGQTLSYEQMWRRVISIAGHLQATLEEGEDSARQSRMIAVFQDRTADWICSLLAIWLVGHIYVPLDTSLPNDRLASIVKDCEPALFIVDDSTLERVSDISLERLSQGPRLLNLSTLSSHEGYIDKETAAGLKDSLIFAKEECPAVVFYTSGSTGAAKGIAIRHSSLVNEIEFSAQEYAIDTHEKVLQQSNLGFDMSLTQIFAALAFGGCVFVCPTNVLGNPLEISRIIARENITVTGGTPSEYLSWLADGSPEVLSHLKSSRWRVAISGGEPVTPGLVQAVRSLGVSRSLGQNYLQLYNAYGPTEVTCSCSRSLVRYDEDELVWPIPAGHTAPNACVTIVDRRLNPLPAGFNGEIAVSGAGVAIEYLHRPEETQKRFVADPHSGNGTRTHRTGDVGRFLNGSLVVEGRISGDTQVKLRGGIRVDLCEIEHAIVDASGGCVVEAVASVRTNITRDEEMAAGAATAEFLVVHVAFSSTVAAADRQAHVASIEEALPALLPRRMIPSLIIPLDKLPRGDTGKLDRRAVQALPLLNNMCGNVGDEYTHEYLDATTLTTDQAKLRKVWETVLPGEVVESQRVTARSDFFRLGGSSLMLPVLQRRIEVAFGVRLSLADMFRASSLCEMTDLIRDPSPRPDSKIDWTCEVDGLLKELREEATHALIKPVRLPKTTPEVVVLTGATGQLGTKLLQLLIEQDTIRTIHCVAVRRPEKLPDHPKVQSHRGSLEQPRLGLSKAQAEVIFQEADVIIHNGALVSHIQSYRSLRAENVTSTVELARLALPRRIPMHYVSSAGVSLYYAAGAQDHRHRSSEDLKELVFGQVSVAAYRPHRDGTDGYVASKWVSERVLEELSRACASACDARALQVVIHRPSHILRKGDLEVATGDNVLENLLELCKVMRKAPQSLKIKGFLNLVELQKCAEGIMKAVVSSTSTSQLPRSSSNISCGSGSHVRYLHHIGEKNVPLHDIKGFIEQDEEGRVDLVTTKEWTDLAEKSGLSSEYASYLRAVDEGEHTYVYPLLESSE